MNFTQARLLYILIYNPQALDLATIASLAHSGSSCMAPTEAELKVVFKKPAKFMVVLKKPAKLKVAEKAEKADKCDAEGAHNYRYDVSADKKTNRTTTTATTTTTPTTTQHLLQCGGRARRVPPQTLEATPIHSTNRVKDLY